jgi:hypothetical protein
MYGRIEKCQTPNQMLSSDSCRALLSDETNYFGFKKNTNKQNRIIFQQQLLQLVLRKKNMEALIRHTMLVSRHALRRSMASVQEQVFDVAQKAGVQSSSDISNDLQLKSQVCVRLVFWRRELNLSDWNRCCCPVRKHSASLFRITGCTSSNRWMTLQSSTNSR